MTFISVSGKCPHCQRDDQLLAPSAADLRRLEVAQRMAEALRSIVDRNFTFFSDAMVGADKKITRPEVLAARDALAEWEKQQ